MATSGSNTTWSSNGGHYIKVTWNETSQSTAENRSAVTVRLYFGSKSGWSISDSSNSYSLTINGTTYNGSNASLSHSSGGETLIMTQNVLIYHNTDGTKTFSMKGAISSLYFGSISGNTFSGTLDTIARKSTLSSSASFTAGSSKTFSISRASSNFSHTLKIYLTKSGVGDDLIRTETFSTSQTSKTINWTNSEIVDQFDNGHGYWTGTRVVLETFSGSTSLGTNEYTGTLSWPSNNTVGSLSSDFDAGQSVGITLNRPTSLYSHEVELRVPDGTVVASRSVTTSTSFTLTPTSTTLYQKSPNADRISVELWIRTVLAAGTTTEVRGWTKEATKTARLKGAPPTLGSLSYADVNTTTTAMTSNNQLIISGKSTPRFTIGEASALHGASIVDYTVSVSGQTKSRTTAGTLDFSPLSAQGNTTATLTVRDSRGVTSSTSVLVQVLSHMNPTVNVALARVNGFENDSTVKVNGTFSSVSGINNVANASAIQYRYRLLPSGTFNAWEDITKTTSGTSFTASTVNVSLPNTNSYQFEVKVVDRVGGMTTVQRTLGAGKPIMHIDTARNAVGVNMFPTISNGLQVDGISDLKGNVTVTGNVTAKKLLVSNITGVGDQLDDLEVQSNFGDFKTFTRASVVGNNESNMQIRPRDDLNSGLQIFTRKDSTGFWDIKDGITWLRYNQAGGNGSATGDITLTPGVSSGKIKLNAAGGVECAARLSANLTHTGGYLVIEHFSPSYGAGQAELWYRGDSRTLSVVSRNPGDTSSSNAKLYADRMTAVAFEAPSTADPGYLQCGSAQEFRVTEYKSSVNYRPIRASSFLNGSSINYKTNLEKIESVLDAIGLIRDTQVFKYHLQSNIDGLIFDKPKVGVIAEMVDPLIRDEDGVDTYSMVSLAWAAIQQQDALIQAQQAEIDGLKEQNQTLLAMLTDLTARIEALES